MNSAWREFGMKVFRTALLKDDAMAVVLAALLDEISGNLLLQFEKSR